MGTVKNISIEFRQELMYKTLDDYGVAGDTAWFHILDTGTEGYNLIILVHAVVEFLLARGRGIPLSLIDKFDAQHPESEEPGDEVNSPYRNEHGLAIGIERIICAYLNIPWKVYEEALLKALGDDQ